MKKLLLSLGALASVATPIAMTISCGDDANTSLDDIKTNAINKINTNGDLTQEQKNELIKMINEAKTETEISEIVEGAGQSALNTSLENIKGDSINKINMNGDLTQEQKDGFVQKIKDAKTEVEVSEIVKEAEQAALDAYKKTKVAYVNALDNEAEGLTDEDKVSTVAAINDADTKEEVDEAVANLRSSALEKYKVANLKLITRSDKLNDADKTAWTDKLNGAKDLASARKVAAEMNNEIFEKAKADALAELNSYKTLPADKKAICEDEINASDDDTTLAAAIEHMQSLAFGEVKNNTKAEVDHYNNWAAKEKDDLKAKIDSVNDVDELNVAVATAKLAHAKQEALKQINLLDSIDSEKASFVQDIKDATTISQVQDIIDNALLQQAKNKAIANINGYKLLDSDKVKFKNNIDKATGTSSIQSILETALLKQSKEENIKIIEGLVTIDKSDKEEYKTRINSATTISSIELITQEAKIRNQYWGLDDFNVTLNDANKTMVSGLSLSLEKQNDLSDDEKLKVVEELLASPLVKIENEYNSKCGEAPWLIVHGKVVPGIHHSLHNLTDDEKVIYVENVFSKISVNRNDDSPDLLPETTWGLKFTEEQTNICPQLTKGGTWTTNSQRQYCLHPDTDGLLSMDSFRMAHPDKLASGGVASKDLPRIFKVEFFNTIFNPTCTAYQRAMTAGSISQVITDESNFIDKAGDQNDLVINGEHFKVTHTSDKLSATEGAAIYDKLVKTMSSLSAAKIEEVKKVSSYNLPDSEKLKLVNAIATAATVKQIDDLVKDAK